MLNNYKVSIIIPMYNAEKYIKECIDSVLNQTYKNIEIIIVNDGSKDNSYLLVDEYRNKYNNITLISQENKGSSYARKVGFEHSKGEFVLFLDSDDWIEPDTVEVFINMLDEEVDIVKAKFIIENDKESIKQEGAFKEKRVIYKKEFKNTIYPKLIESFEMNSISGELIRRRALDFSSIKLDVFMGDDLLVSLELYKNSRKIIFLDKYFLHYRKNQNSITNSLDINILNRNLNNAIFVYSKMLEYLKMYQIDTIENRKKLYLRILSEITGNSIKYFYVKNIKIKDIFLIYKEIWKKDIIKDIKNNINIFNIVKNNYRNKALMFSNLYGIKVILIIYYILIRIKIKVKQKL